MHRSRSFTNLQNQIFLRSYCHTRGSLARAARYARGPQLLRARRDLRFFEGLLVGAAVWTIVMLLVLALLL